MRRSMVQVVDYLDRWADCGPSVNPKELAGQRLCARLDGEEMQIWSNCADVTVTK